MRRLLTASKSGLACGYFLNPEVDLPEDVPGPAAEFGTKVHDAIEHRLTKREPAGLQIRPPVPADVQAHVDTAVAYVEREYGGCPKEYEIAFGFDGRSVKCLGYGRETYAAKPTPEAAVGLEVAGTIDLLVHLGGDDWAVDDWKSGNAYNAGPQLRTLAALVLVHNGGDTCRMRAVQTGTGAVVEYGVLDGMDAMEHLLSLSEPSLETPTAGDHCSKHYCPLVGRCPAFKDTAKLIPVDAIVRGRINPLLTSIDSLPKDRQLEAAQVGAELFAVVKALLKKRTKELAAFAKANGGSFPMANGQTFKGYWSSRTSIKGKEALELARKLGASQEELAGLISATPFEVYKAVGKKNGSAVAELEQPIEEEENDE